jgi:hypothetical protein
MKHEESFLKKLKENFSSFNHDNSLESEFKLTGKKKLTG